jgi:hypothetical protein
MVSQINPTAKPPLNLPLIRPGKDDVTGLRKFPFPYRSALTIDNDADAMTKDKFLGLFEFFNTSKDTPLGRGLGLRLSSSFFLTSYSGNEVLSFCEPGTISPGPDADFIRTYIEKATWMYCTLGAITPA